MQNPAPQRFAPRFNMLLKSIIRQRKRLILDNISGLPQELVQPKLDYLSRYIDYGFSDKGAATFLIDNQTKLKYLVPNNRAGLSTMNHIDSLLTAAKILTTKSLSHAN
jgi:hypothetical protein